MPKKTSNFKRLFNYNYFLFQIHSRKRFLWTSSCSFVPQIYSVFQIPLSKFPKIFYELATGSFGSVASQFYAAVWWSLKNAEIIYATHTCSAVGSVENSYCCSMLYASIIFFPWILRNMYLQLLVTKTKSTPNCLCNYTSCMLSRDIHHSSFPLGILVLSFPFSHSNSSLLICVKAEFWKIRVCQEHSHEKWAGSNICKKCKNLESCKWSVLSHLSCLYVCL